MSMSLIILFLVVVTVIILALFFTEGQQKKEYKYSKRNRVMTESEAKCFFLLETAVGRRYYIFPQIHLPSIFDNRIKGQNWFGAFRHIDEKSVDFVLCRKHDLCPVLGIELDDKSHERSDRVIRDKEVERIFSSTGLALLRIKTRDNFSPEVLTAIIEALINAQVTHL